MSTFTFARRTLDPGLFSDNAVAMQRFYTDTIGLPLLERLQHDDSYAEIFFELPEGKLKIQASTNPMQPASSGYWELYLARDVAEPITRRDPDGLTVHVVPPMRRGFTYITLVVHEAESCRDALIAAGASNSLRLMRLADRCLFAWLRDPHGNWIEILQYEHLSGELPDIDRIADNWDEVIAWRETGNVPVA